MIYISEFMYTLFSHSGCLPNNDGSQCKHPRNIKQDTHLAELRNNTLLILWDEVQMENMMFRGTGQKSKRYTKDYEREH
jgi:hypothetical protein